MRHNPKVMLNFQPAMIIWLVLKMLCLNREIPTGLTKKKKAEKQHEPVLLFSE